MFTSWRYKTQSPFTSFLLCFYKFKVLWFVLAIVDRKICFIIIGVYHR